MVAGWRFIAFSLKILAEDLSFEVQLAAFQLYHNSLAANFYWHAYHARYGNRFNLLLYQQLEGVIMDSLPAAIYT